jgi:arsenate reductase
MKKLFLLLLLLAFYTGYSQKISFNNELNLMCKTYAEEFSTIPAERKATLDGMARQLAKKKYILFTCQTNSRRTILLQIWAQTSFYYFGLWDRSSFSIGDTVTEIHPEAINTLKESGFSCAELGGTDAKGYIVSISPGYENIVLSKNHLGTIDTAKVVVVSICFDGERSNIAATTGHVNLPYKSPREFENTPQEKQKYSELNRQISIEMLYLAEKTREVIEDEKGSSK